MYSDSLSGSSAISRDHILLFVSSLDVPDCDCDVYARCDCTDRRHCDCPAILSQPCEHVRAAVDHGLSLAEWTELLMAASGDYADRPLPAAASAVLTRESRIAVMAARQAAGLALRHPGDLWVQDCQSEAVAIRAERSRNGSVGDGVFQVAGRVG